MADLFNRDFEDFIEALNRSAVEYLLVGGYAVILHGYIWSTADMDVWVNKTSANYQRLKTAFSLFGAPIFSEEEFLGSQFDVWGIGVETNRIKVLSDLKGLNFSEVFPLSKVFIQNGIEIKYIDLSNLIKAKEAVGRFKDKDDIEQLRKRK